MRKRSEAEEAEIEGCGVVALSNDYMVAVEWLQ